MKRTHLSFQRLIVIISLVCLHIYEAFSWKLQLCLNGTLEEISSDKCKYGVWFPEPRVIHKICFERGVWAVYKEFCDENPVIWSVLPGSQGCIPHHILGKRVAGVVNLGQDDYGAISATDGRRLFLNNHKMKHGMRLDFLDSMPEIDILTWGNPSVTFSIQILEPNGKIKRFCLEKGKQAFFAYYKFPLHTHKNVSYFLGKNLCFDQRQEIEDREHLYPDEIDFDVIASSSEEIRLNCTKFKGIDEPFEDWEKYDSDDKSKIRIIERRVDEQTQRVVLKLLHYHFAFPNMEMVEKKYRFDEWQFLNLVKQLFLRACPTTMVPQFFIDQIYLLFLGVLYEAVKTFPMFQGKNEDANKRIYSGLEECLKRDEILMFKDPKLCKKDDNPLLMREIKNGSMILFFVDMPSFIKIDITNYDLIMESIWKMMNFAHYMCVDSFSVTDQALLERHWGRLFTKAILTRWKYPGQSYRFMERIFMSIDLERTIKNVDYCVSAARAHSSITQDYKSWLKRPVTRYEKQTHFEVSKEKKLIWNGQAHCLDDFMYPARKMGFPIEKCGIKMPQVPLKKLY